MKFTTDIIDPDQLAWIEKARLEYNAKNPQNQLADEAAYFSWLVSGWFTTGAIQNKDKTLDEAVTKAKAGDATDLVAVAAALPKK